jgi:DNA helicase II / ATP-dependent DNA helicase PcrA
MQARFSQIVRLFDLNPQQLEAVRTTPGPVLILAGAGTGKTRVITARIMYLLSEGVAPEKILAVTFTNKAANEMRTRVNIERENKKKLTLCTFHALCLRILRRDIQQLGYKANFSIYDESDQLGLLRKIITRLTSQNEKLDPAAASRFISKTKNQRLSVTASDASLQSALFHRYQEALKTYNAVDFDDLLVLAVQLLAEFPDVREHWQQKYEFSMVDEFQDTTRLQLDLVLLLGGTHRNVCVVGDDDQSIYGWRGAEISNILEFERHFPNPKIIKLEQNYRSTNAILGTANGVIQHNPRRRPKALWSDNGDGRPVHIVAVPDDREEAGYVVGDIQKQKLTQECRWSDFAVIFRMNAQSRLFEENLRRLHIPYRLVGGRSFFERREVKDLLAYLACIANPEDDVSLLRIINTPARGIGASTVELAIQESSQANKSIFETLQADNFQRLLSQRALAGIRRFTELIDRYETRIAQPLTDLARTVEELLSETDYFQDLRRSCKTPEESLNREENVRELIRAISGYQKRSTDGVSGFLAEAALDDDRDEKLDENADGVTLITFHAAKGLEFNHVFLVGIEEGILPHNRSKLEGSLDEERRLFYVGITRAKRSLAITHCANRLKYGSPAPCHPSVFLKNLDTRFTEVVNYHELTNKPAGEQTARQHFARIRELLGGN